MRHPYAIIPNSRPASLFSAYSRPGTPERPPLPPPPPPPKAPQTYPETQTQPNRRPTKNESLQPVQVPVLGLPSILPMGGIARPRSAPGTREKERHSKEKERKARVVAGHYVKHSSRFTLLLSGQPEGVDMPVYSNGQTIEGILAIARPLGLLAVEVKIEGSISIEETGSLRVRMIDETVYSWTPARDGPFPPNVAFRYTLPDAFLDPMLGTRYPLPPTFRARLATMPGFTVNISYAVVVSLTRQREAATLWRGVTNAKVPFRYTHLTRPALQGPFPYMAQKTESGPRTLFVFQMRRWRSSSPGIKVHVYLPASQVCSVQEPIPFHVSLLGDELALEPFAEYRPVPASFLPLSTSWSGASSTCEYVANAITTRSPRSKAARRCPLRIQIQRATVVDSRSALHLHHTEWVGQGVVHSVSRTINSVVWSGAIIIPSDAARLGGSFEVNGLKVMDSVVLAIEPPTTSSGPQYIPLNETIPVRLTSDSFGCQTAMAVSPM
ncbi:hypothetical protein C8Q70DRAFT_909835 [Cubamyces menziesii]|nr:hypothetical protein C8Q70DRAFT_909835 [Cubamyces menziesii]